MTQPATNVAAIAAALRVAPNTVAELIAAMRLDTETRLAALEAASGGTSDNRFLFTRAAEAAASDAISWPEVFYQAPTGGKEVAAIKLIPSNDVGEDGTDWAAIQIDIINPGGAGGGSFATLDTRPAPTGDGGWSDKQELTMNLSAVSPVMAGGWQLALTVGKSGAGVQLPSFTLVVEFAE